MGIKNNVFLTFSGTVMSIKNQIYVLKASSAVKCFEKNEVKNISNTNYSLELLPVSRDDLNHQMEENLITENIS